MTHLQLSIDSPFELILSPLDQDYERKAHCYNDFPEWISVLDSAITPFLSSIALICTANQGVFSCLYENTQAAVNFLMDRKHIPKVHLITDSSYSLSSFSPNFLKIITSLELTLDAECTQYEDTNLNLRVMTILESLAIMTINEDPYQPSTEPLVIPSNSSLKTLIINDNKLGCIQDIPPSVTTLVCNLTAIIPNIDFMNLSNKEQLDELTALELPGITNLCITNFSAAHIMFTINPAVINTYLSSYLSFPNLSKLAIVTGSIDGSDTSASSPTPVSFSNSENVRTRSYSEEYNANTNTSFVQSLLFKNGHSVTSLYFSGFPKELASIAPKYTPILANYQIDSYDNNSESALTPSLHCETKLKTKKYGMPFTFTDELIHTISEYPCSSSIDTISFRIPVFPFKKSSPPTPIASNYEPLPKPPVIAQISFPVLQNATRKLPNLKTLRLLDDTLVGNCRTFESTFGFVPQSPISSTHSQIPHYAGLSSHQKSSFFTKIERFASSPSAVFSHEIEATQAFKVSSSHKARFSPPKYSGFYRPSSPLTINSEYAPLSRSNSRIDPFYKVESSSSRISSRSTLVSATTKEPGFAISFSTADKFIRPNWNNGLIGRTCNIEMIRSI